ncbi:helix-turn-helix transcriptional regulator [Yimella sp. cx-573]|nr:helix-turn-helix transcriptional regulator [Yimella sp. cx-573]
MLTGDTIRLARQRAGWSQQELAEKVGVSMRSIGNYERGDSIPRNRMPVLEEVLAPYTGGAGPSLQGASDAQLLAEIARRFDRGTEQRKRRSDDEPPITRAAGSAADDYGLAARRGDPEQPLSSQED